MVHPVGQSDVQIDYAGFPGDKDLPEAVERAAASELTPQAFWERYICPRKPVILDGHLPDVAWRASKLWTDEYLIKRAGGAQLEVEERKSTAEGYGKGKKTGMSFGECLRRLADGDTTLYLTTQKVAVGEDGHPEVFGQPIQELAGDLPLRPCLLGNLIPQQVNLWAGCAPDGSSSGLHHDYHDNLYILLRGKKRFRLFPPSLAGSMYVHGELRRVHPNGRIVHKSQGDVLADGSDAKDVAQWQARRAAERELKAAEEALSKGEEGAKERLAAAEEALDNALEAALEQEAGWAGPEDFDALEEEGADDEEEEEEGREEETAAAENVGPSGAAQETGTAGDPDSFSRVDLSRPASELHEEFPLFPGADAAMVCEVHAGQMLFVPAGWFHEVSSFSTPDSATHMALNYWCHPPDNLDPSAQGFNKPYKSDYWADIWEGRAHQYASPAKAPAAAAEDVPTPATGPAPKVQAARGAGAGEGEGDEQPSQPARRKRGRDEYEGEGAAEQAPGFKARLVQRLYGLARLVGLVARREAQV